MQHTEMFFESLLLDSPPCLLGLFVSVGSTLVWLLSYTVHLIPQLTNGVTVCNFFFFLPQLPRNTFKKQQAYRSSVEKADMLPFYSQSN